MFVAIMAFFARISDPAVGGTYMTMLNTLTNLGGNWPATLALWSVDHLTWKRCQIDLSEVINRVTLDQIGGKSRNKISIFPAVILQLAVTHLSFISLNCLCLERKALRWLAISAR